MSVSLEIITAIVMPTVMIPLVAIVVAVLLDMS